MKIPASPQILRFAPSPNGLLHLGHAYSALLNFDRARQRGGTFLLRIEDIDTTRCRPEFETAIFEDLHWLGLSWPEPVMRQSNRSAAYKAALAKLSPLLYPCFCNRSALAKASAGQDPLGAPLYPGTCRHLSRDEQNARKQREPFALRLDMQRARDMAPALMWQDETQSAPIPARPELWGDVILARKDIGTSYHLAVVVDDAAQNINHVLRGQDLFAATHIHRLLQFLLDLPTPLYHHHALLRDEKGEKLAKSHMSKPLRQWRNEGATPENICAMIGLNQP